MSAKIDPNDALVLLIDLQAGIADKPLTVRYKDLQKGGSGTVPTVIVFPILE